MRLKRIEAVRFGRLESATLGDLGEGLSIVHGPNEAGKSSFTALVRHVLYGFPKKSESEAGYESAGGKRQGRLVFADDTGEWAVERLEGPHGGAVTVSSIEGPARGDVLGSITAGVSREAYRVVFGFGLGEMAEIESGLGSGDDVLSRLYAAQAGLAVNPRDVWSDLERSAAELFKARGSAPEINRLKASITDAKGRIRGLEEQASRFSAEQARLRDLAEELAGAAAERDRLAGESVRLAESVRRLDEAERRRAEIAEELSELTATVGPLEARYATLPLEETVLAAAPEIEALVRELSGFQQRLLRLNELEAAAGQARRDALAALETAGIDQAATASADIGPETQAGVERWRTEITALGVAVEQADGAAREARAQAAAYEESEPAGATGGNWLGWSALGLGVLIAAVSAVFGQWFGVGAGVLLAVFGLTVRAAARGVSVDARPGHSAAELEQAAAAAQEMAAATRVQRETRISEYRAWLDERGLSLAGPDPSAAVLLIAALKDHRRFMADSRDRAEAARVEQDACERFASRVASAVALCGVSFDGVLGEVGAALSRARERVETAQAASREREAIAGKIEQQRARITGLEARDDGLAAEMSEVVSTLDADDAAEVRVRAASATAAYDEAQSVFETLAADRSKLEGELGTEARESSMGALRLELAGLQERQASAVERYSVLAVASALLERAREEYERTRQPEVVRLASGVLDRITGGRYTRIAVPSSGGEMLVFDAASEAKPSSQLSRGTQEQLYLALRLALIEQLGQVGAGLPVLMDDILVNFDPGRREGAARAIADLASRRQVVFFTCHPDTLDLLSTIAPAHTVVTLDRC